MLGLEEKKEQSEGEKDKGKESMYVCSEAVSERVGGGEKKRGGRGRD